LYVYRWLSESYEYDPEGFLGHSGFYEWKIEDFEGFY
jgi:hypothetical protein